MGTESGRWSTAGGVVAARMARVEKPRFREGPGWCTTGECYNGPDRRPLVAESLGRGGGSSAAAAGAPRFRGGECPSLSRRRILPGVSTPPLHVLFVARWYPSHDQPGRGTFVADLAAALIATGRARVTVASFDPTHVRGVADTRRERAREAASVLADAVVQLDTLHSPVSWGARDIPVARLPVILDGNRRRPSDLADAHAEPLLAFARALGTRRRIDVIHAHTGLPDGIAALRVADELNLPLLVTEHASTTADDLVDDEARALYRRLVAPPRRVVAVSRALAHDVAQALGVGENVIDVLPNAVPVDDFPMGAAAGRQENELLYVGSRKASKGIETLVRAFADVRSHRPEIRLRLIGSPGPADDEARWQALAGSMGVAEAVTFERAAPRDEVAAAMRRAALFVHPSPHETFGMVAAEALASGLPVAATPSGGVDEIVGRDGRFGAIATSTSVPALADAIDRALAVSSRVDRAAMRAHVESRYAAPAVARRAIDAYEAVAAQTRALPRQGRAAPVASPSADAGESRAPFGLPLVLALARGQAVERLGLLPPALRDGLTIVTSPRGKYADDRDLPPWGHWLELDQERFFRDALADLERSVRPAGGLGRLKAAFGGPNLDRARRDLAARKDIVRREGTQQFLRDAIEQVERPGPAGGAGGRPSVGHALPWIVALDADDIVMAVRLASSVGRIAPGGLRWLADAWDAAGRPG